MSIENIGCANNKDSKSNYSEKEFLISNYF